MNQLTDAQKRVVNEARNRLKNLPWYSGICIDNLPTEEEISESFENAVLAVCAETAMYDSPDFFNNY